MFKRCIEKNQRTKSEKYLKEFPVAFETEKNTKQKPPERDTGNICARNTRLKHVDFKFNKIRKNYQTKLDNCLI